MKTPLLGRAGSGEGLRLWKFVRAVVRLARWKLALALGLMIALALAAGVTVLLAVPILRAAGLDLAAKGPPSSSLFAWMAAVSSVRHSLLAALAVLILITAAQAALNSLRLRLTVAISHDVVMGLRQELFERVCRIGWVSYSALRSSDLSETLTAETDRVGPAVQSVLGLAGGVIAIVVYVTLAFRLSPLMTAVTLLSGAALTALLVRLRRRPEQAVEDQAPPSKQLYSLVSESLMSMKAIRTFAAERHHVFHLTAVGDREKQERMELAEAYGTAKLWFDVAAVSLLCLVTLIAIRYLAMPAAMLLVLLFIFARMALQLASLQQGYQNVKLELPAFESVMSTMRASESTAEPRADRQSVSFEDCVRVEGVTYGYGDERALTDVSLAIPAGRVVAIVGPSSSGKSTLADLVLGLLTPREGRILIDGTPLGPETITAWREKVGYVPQDVFLFHDTVRANLLWAAPEATSDALWSALTAASAARFVAHLPQGIDTVVGDRGMRLSTGERQRLGLARALLRRPKLLIFDEAMSSLDPENERVIEQTAHAHHGRVTILLVTQRLTSVRRADMIYVLDQGHLVEAGGWDELMGAADGRFHALCRAQGIQPTPATSPEFSTQSQEGAAHVH